MSLMRRWLYFRNRSEPLRQATLLLLLSGAAGRGESLLHVLRAQIGSSRGEWSQQLLQLATLLESGHSLTTALSLTDDLLPPNITAAIAAAESTGCLPAVMRDEAERLIGQMTEGGGTASGLAFTSAVNGTMLVTLTAFNLIFIMPRLSEIFLGFGLELPGPTTSFFALADFFESFWHFLVLPAAGISCWGMWYVWRDSRHRLLHGCPLYAHAWPQYWVPGLLRMCSTAIAAGEPLLPCVMAAVQQLPAGRASDRMLDLRDLLERGEQLPAALTRTRLLSRRDAAFLESATAAGHPDWAMRQLADQLDRRRTQRIRRRQVLTAWGLQATVALFVLWFVLALFMPLIKLVNDLS